MLPWPVRLPADALAAKHSNFKIHYIVDKTDNKAWKGRYASEGRS